jgi:hypothetical protein
LICSSKAVILFLGATVWGGAWHDFELLKKNFRPEVRWFRKFKLWMDKAYQGFEKYYKAKQVNQPQKKPRKSKNNPDPQLSEEQIEKNRAISSKRMVVEHAIRGMKRYNVLVYPLRTFAENLLERIIGICAGLWNFKIDFNNH